jgi:argonaute-like protein implicated in RNA metabolism and viral defense
MRKKEIYRADFVNVQPSPLRLYREGRYPPYRGTALELEPERHLLYSRGSVEYYGTYPGQYVPQPIEVRRARGDSSVQQLTEEVLALTKMNWNNTRFDGKMPITIECARKVGEIMRHVDPDETPDVSYRYYM